MQVPYMKLIIAGIEHTERDSAVRDFIVTLMGSEEITLIGEERPGASGSVAEQVAQSKGIRWVQIDMTTAERIKAGIHDKLAIRMLHWPKDEHGIPIPTFCYASEEDGQRERFWLDRIAEQKPNGTVLVVCGPGHVRPLSEKAQQEGYDTQLFFLPEHPGSQFWVSTAPRLF